MVETNDSYSRQVWLVWYHTNHTILLINLYETHPISRDGSRLFPWAGRTSNIGQFGLVLFRRAKRRAQRPFEIVVDNLSGSVCCHCRHTFQLVRNVALIAVNEAHGFWIKSTVVNVNFVVAWKDEKRVRQRQQTK